MASFSR